jgi:hypothetical protein
VGRVGRCKKGRQNQYSIGVHKKPQEDGKKE